MFDLRYVLRNRPESLADLREPVIEAFSKFIDLLGMVQNADPLKRQRGIHVEREQPWEILFNFLIVLQQPIQQFIQWCISDRAILVEAVRMTLRKHEQIAGRDHIPYKRHEVAPDLVGSSKMELFVFDIQKEAVSIHQPLARVLAGLLTGASAHNLSLPDLLQISSTDVQSPLFLMEVSSRVLVLAAQVNAGMWKRNGYSVARQVGAYQYHYPRGMMYDKDIVMLQAMAAVLDPSVFLYSVIHKFRLDTWIASPGSDPSVRRGESSEDALRFFLNEAEEFVFLFITIFCERWVAGVGEGVKEMDSLRRELVHKLFIAPLSHSQILKEFRMSERENEIDQLLKKVATLRKGGGMSKAVFVLRAEFEDEYNPFFYHYTRTDHSMAEDAQRRRIKAAGGILSPEAASPAELPPLCGPFQGVLRLTASPVTHRLFNCVFRQAADPVSKFWSDKLLHESLYLCAVMLREEDSSRPDSLASAAIGLHGANGFLEELVTLLCSRRAEEHKPLLSWIVQNLKKYREKSTGRSSPPTSAMNVQLEAGGSAVRDKEMAAILAQDKALAERKELVRKQKEKAMAQMQSMQRKFLEKNRQQMLDLEGPEVDEPDVGPSVAVKSPTLRAVGLTVLVGRPPETREEETCILCQADSKDAAVQDKVFVQAVCVQRSCVLRQSSTECSPADVKELDTKCDYLAARADQPLGMFTSGCGHHMHADCWKRFIESKQQEHGRRYFYPLPGQSVQWTSGEFLCPLCQSFSNSVVPLLPPVCSAPSEAPQANVGFSEWREIVDLAVDLAESKNVLEGNQPHLLWDKLSELFRNFKRPSSYLPGRPSERRDMISIFSQCTYMMAFKADPDERNERVCVAEWNNCAYTITSLEMNTRRQGQSLLSTLSSRQVDYLGSLVKIGLDPALRPSLNQLGSIVRRLVNSFLLESPPFSENPSILEIDAFSMMVSLPALHPF
ncbi:E3 ubiquitin-protein ligase UBR2, partial [Geodia barretti]